MTTSTHRELRRLSNVFVARGVLLLLLGLGALVWPETFLLTAMMLVGIIAVLFGIYEISIALVIRRQQSEWRIVATHGIAVVLFGLMTVGAPGLPSFVALAVVAAWFFLYASVMLVGAAVPWPMGGARRALVVCGVVDIVVAALTVLYPVGTMLALLGFGAIYAALFGLWHIALGGWLRRHSPDAEHFLGRRGSSAASSQT